ncbi:DNA-binding HxlR family transcriptional regulator [Mumia flava]|uniref:DNA-binding HxlR family transcriptional regulator n=1 Tax=Mumia flava TaxID=1348852 RepID=A0A0B2AYP6_9ACTN|nr:helix-turn-helix domain-containing protein [Mumia flava]PJJ56125.1 DNA-binding HxlR family transcriptional regulator [Mumia flava]
MRRTSFEDMNCSIAQSLEIVGEWWTPLILRDALMGVRRFEQFQSRLGIARNVLATRLQTLVERGVLEEVPYSDRPVRHEYVLTEMGRELWTVMTMLLQWGDRWLAPDGAPVELVHDTCGEVVHAELMCSGCGEALQRSEVSLRHGPGAPDGGILLTDDG